MSILDPFGYGTHEVLNQAPAMADYDAYSDDPALGKILSIFNAEWAAPHASAVGKRVGSARVQELARQANRNLPELRTHDRWGRRVDQIEFHPAWHELMTLAMRDEFHSLCWTKPKPGAQVARRGVVSLEPGRERNLLPARYDVFSDPDIAPRSGPLGRVRQTRDVDRL
jgi:putative acyl-CoA dehydrogenase